MDKETLSNYGWIVICVLVLAVMIALAGPFGGFIADAVKSTTQGLFDVNQNALNSTGLINIDGQEFDVPDMNHGAGNGDNAGGGYDHYAPELHPNDGTGVYDGMIYTFGNYEYRYNQSYDNSGNFSNNLSQNGWGVRLINDVADPGPILESINGQPVTNMSNTFANRSSVTTAPEIPSSVTNMASTFYGCASLTTASEIPNGVKSMNKTFYGCTSLTTAPEIPSSVTSMANTFSGCTSLTTAPEIPSSVTTMSATFNKCTSLNTYVGSTDPDGDFSRYVIPSSVTDMAATFKDCASLTTAPEIPSSVTNMPQTFSGCTSLTGTITINTTPTGYSYCFNSVDMSKITLAGSCDSVKKQAIANTGINSSQVTIID